jgi:hypothetical protein
VLAPLAPAMRLADGRATCSSCRQAAVVLAAPTPAVRLAMLRVASSRLGATLVLAPFASTVRNAVRRAACSSPLRAALLLTQPLAHGTPPLSSHSAQTQLQLHSQPSPTPSQPSAIHWCTLDTTYTPMAVREQVRRCCMSRSTWSTALGRGTYGGCVVGEDGKGLLRTLHRQVHRLLARRAASPNPDGRLEHTPLHTATRRPQHDGGTPWSVPAGLRVGLS